MTSDSVRPPEKRYGYSNALTGLITLIKEEGIRGLARGVGTNTTRAVLMNVKFPIFTSTLADWYISTFVLLHLGVSSRIVSEYQCLPRYVRLIICTTSYDYFKTLLLGRPIPIIDYQLRDSLLLHVIASCLAGTIATSSYPGPFMCG